MGKWEDQKMAGMVGDKDVEIIATYTDEADVNAQVALFRFENSDSIKALRWCIGSIMDLGTNDLEEAKGSINTMIIMEQSDTGHSEDDDVSW